MNTKPLNILRGSKMSAKMWTMKDNVVDQNILLHIIMLRPQTN